MIDIQPYLQEASSLLAKKFGGEVVFGAPEFLTDEERYSLVARLPLTQQPEGAPAQVILKGPNLEAVPEADRPHMLERFLMDWAGSEFLDRFEDDFSPRFFGGSTALQFFLMEDLGVPDTLVQPLLEGNPRSADAALERFMLAIGKMHAAAAGESRAYTRIVAGLSNMPATPYLAGFAPDLKEKVQETAEKFEIVISAAELENIQTVLESIANPGPFRTFIHSDPCPDNLYDDGRRVRLIDFETGGFGHALLDAAYPRMAFPTCWCANRTPAARVEALEALYRRTIAAAMPAAGDDALFYEAITMACGFWMLIDIGYRVRWAFHDPARKWGIANIPMRLATHTEAFACLAEKHGHLVELTGLARRFQAQFRKEWPEYEPLPFYPAFEEHGS